jgi:glyoxylase-like metal-dependent hydrolase (beta-lactamase superfamily II)
MRVHHLNTGTMCPRGALWVNGRGGPFERARLVCHVLLVETAEGLVLIDGGLGLGDVRDPARLGRHWVRLTAPRLDEAETAVAQVRALGFDPGDVRHIVLTHLDLDHAGAVPDFPEAAVHVHALEIAEARRRASTGQRYLREQLPTEAQVRAFEDGGERWFGFEGARPLHPKIAEIALVPLRGHTLGHTGVAVRDGDRWRLHAGDAYFHHGQMSERPSVPLLLRIFQRRGDEDREARVANQERLRRLALDASARVDVFCAHDPFDYDRLASPPSPSVPVASSASALVMKTLGGTEKPAAR